MALDHFRGVAEMDAAMMIGTMKMRSQTAAKRKQMGFSLLETVIAIVVLMVGLLAVLATFALAIGNTTSVQNDSIARQKAGEAIESIYTARQTSQITFDQIQNQGTGTGIFKVGFTAMTDPGNDGLDNTADDVAATPIRLPGGLGEFHPADSDYECAQQSERPPNYGDRAVPGTSGLVPDLPGAVPDFVVPVEV
jgi:Tfp pilus assembly protein PilV